MEGFFLVAALFAGSLAMYLLPTIVAVGRKHPEVGAIALLNLLFGWTVIAWVAALRWCFRYASAESATRAPSAPAATAPSA